MRGFAAHGRSLPLDAETLADAREHFIGGHARLATPRGVIPLRKFFSGGLQTKSSDAAPGGEQLAWDAIKEALREVIDAEDKSNPLSDEALVDELKKRGIEIARRTVAKYRDQLQIPTARLRKKF